MENNYSFSALLFRQKYIKRWALMRNTSEENLSTHACECAMLTHMLCVIANKIYGKNINTERAVLTALYHDASEVITGDLPTPIKYYSGAIKTSYDEIEENAISTLLSKLPPELREDYSSVLHDDSDEIRKTVKIADKLCAHIKCLEEIKCGNSEFRLAAVQTRKALDAYKCDELDYFMENMLPAFEKTLDEI